MKDETDKADAFATHDMPASEAQQAKPAAAPNARSAFESGSGRLEVRCPNCHSPTDVAVDTSLTDLTCSSCGSHFSLVDQSQATRIAPSLAKLGRFELIERIGVGGFGSVWKARDKELDRTVAIKIPRAGGMTAEDQEKFFREARAAAQLRHPNIVSVHEVGRDGDSVYIVSDFVHGVTLGDWLTGQKPTSREAVELCAKIADALHHAHEQGVVHRDLKPANVMIDGEVAPHLMDFGLARREVGEVTVTMDGQIMGTPAYMTPEQALGEGHTADRRSDIYSLGVILFQLLTGELPFRGNARMLMHQVIHDEPPSPRTLNANISKDLETITLKCLEKDSVRRYQSAHDLAEEFRRFLAGKPILARPVSRPERVVRWVRRNRMVSALAASVAIALLCGTIVSTYFAIDARRQAKIALARENDALVAKQDADTARRNEETRRTQAEQAQAEERKAKESAIARQAETAAVLEFVEKKILAAARPIGLDGGLGVDITLRGAITAALPYVQSAFVKQPLIEARLRQTLGESFTYIGEYKVAADQFQRSRTLYTEHLGTGHRDTIISMRGVAQCYADMDKADEALKLREEALSLCRTNLGDDDPDTAKAMLSVAKSYNHFGRRTEALKLLEGALRIAKVKFGSDDLYTWSISDELASAYANLGRRDEAVKLAQANFDIVKARLGPDNASTLIFAIHLAGIIGDTKRVSQLYEESFPRVKATFGIDHPTTLACMINLASCYADNGRNLDALKLREATLSLYKKKLGVEYPETLIAEGNLAQSYAAIGMPNEAIKLYEDVTARQKAKSLDNNRFVYISSLAVQYERVGRYADAGKIYEELLKINQAKVGPEHMDNLGRMSGLAWLYSTCPDEKARNGRRALELVSKACEIGKYKNHYHLESLAAACAETGDFDSAVKWEKKSLEVLNADRDSQKTLLERAGSLFTTDPDSQEFLRRIELYKAKKPLRMPPAENKPIKDAAIASALYDVAWTLATSHDDAARDPARALVLATRACEMTDYKNPRILDSLAVANEKNGNLADAIKWSEKALEILGPNGDLSFRQQIENAIAGYKSKTPQPVAARTVVPADARDLATRFANFLNDETSPRAVVDRIFAMSRGSAEDTETAISQAKNISLDAQLPPIQQLKLGELMILGDEPQKAIPIIERAIANGGNDSYFQKSLGWALWKANRRQESLKTFEKALGHTSLQEAGIDQCTAAYFLDRLSQKDFIARAAKDVAVTETFAWFYIGQRDEAEGATADAINAYQHSIEAVQTPRAQNTIAKWSAYRLECLKQKKGSSTPAPRNGAP